MFFHVADIDHPACADPEHLGLVDEAFKRPGGPAAARMRENLCAGCPGARQCLTEAMDRGEWGVWGGTSPNFRTRHGGAKPRIRTKVA